ncbi:MAG: hypothetical protein A2481_02310 [Candidatus Yonathbacteria bacterium RIFOXYC2_FULL_47_9]|nr:MAG: hypothetical protein A2481_02310 [Candidatus Yonathbacteria bacterium RIFOXYC2_FULL_47_9]HAT68533.1 hypothetical protein [Candidatus Yonathbacteria bacterium]
MDSIFEHYKKTGYLHHAHLIEGDAKTLVPILLAALERHMGIVAQGNPDVATLFYDSFGINESRDLTEMQSRAGFGAEAGTPKIFVVSAPSFTHEAQNALLKTFEEPTAGTHFFIILPRVDTILPTLKSRVVLSFGHAISENKDDTSTLAEKFLSASLEERFALAKKLTDKKTGESVDRERIRRFLDHIERILYTRLAGKKEGSEIFREIFQTKTYLSDRGSSPKMLIEHLAMAIVL